MQVTSPNGGPESVGKLLSQPLDPKMATSGALIAKTIQEGNEMTQTMQMVATGKGANLNIRA